MWIGLYLLDWIISRFVFVEFIVLHNERYVNSKTEKNIKNIKLTDNKKEKISLSGYWMPPDNDIFKCK